MRRFRSIRSQEGVISLWIMFFTLILLVVTTSGVLSITNSPTMRKQEATSVTFDSMQMVAQAVRDYAIKQFGLLHRFSLPGTVDDLISAGVLNVKYSRDVWQSKFEIYYFFPCGTSDTCPVPVEGCPVDDEASYPQFIVVSAGPDRVFQVDEGYVQEVVNSEGHLPVSPPEGSDDLIQFGSLKPAVDAVLALFKKAVLQPLTQVLLDYWTMRYQACCKFYGDVFAGEEGWKSCPISFDLPLSCVFTGNVPEAWKDLFNPSPSSCSAPHPLCSWNSLEEMVMSKLSNSSFFQDRITDIAGEDINFVGPYVEGSEIGYEVEIACYYGRTAMLPARLRMVVPSKVYSTPASEF